MGLMNYKRTHIPTTPFFFFMWIRYKMVYFLFYVINVLGYWEFNSIYLIIEF